MTSYSYFEFDTESRTFICPLCKDCCNCANCIRKRKLGHLLDGKKGLNRRLLAALQAGAAGAGGDTVPDYEHDAQPGGRGVRTTSLAAFASGNASGHASGHASGPFGTVGAEELEGLGQKGLTIQDVLMRAVKDRVGVPFDRVRLVCRDEDVITPELPPLPVLEEAKVRIKGKGKGKGKGGGKGKEGGKGKKGKEAEDVTDVKVQEGLASSGDGQGDTGGVAGQTAISGGDGQDGQGKGRGKGHGKGQGKSKSKGKGKTKKGAGALSGTAADPDGRNTIPIDPVLLALDTDSAHPTKSLPHRQ